MNERAEAESGSGPSRLSPTQWLALALTVLALVFILMNRDTTSIDFFGATVQAPLWLVLIVIFAVGWLTGLLTAHRKQKRRQQTPNGGKAK